MEPSRDPRAAREFSRTGLCAPDGLYAPWVEIARRLAELAPGRLERCYRATTGTEAVEAAMQIARAFTGREKVIAIENDYHGNSIAVHDIARVVKPPLDEHALARLKSSSVASARAC